MSKRDERESHPSYGLLSIVRGVTNAVSLFASSITHNNVIRMYVRNAEVARELNNDYIYSASGPPLIELEMSMEQFANAITSMNMGDGVPVTIKYIKDHEPIPPCPYTNKTQQFEDEFDQNIKDGQKELAALIGKTTELFNTKKALTIAEKKEIMGNLQHIQRLLTESQSFLYTQFNEQMHKTVNEAKLEIEAYATNTLINIANNAISANINKNQISENIKHIASQIEINSIDESEE